MKFPSDSTQTHFCTFAFGFASPLAQPYRPLCSCIAGKNGNAAALPYFPFALCCSARRLVRSSLAGNRCFGSFFGFSVSLFCLPLLLPCSCIIFSRLITKNRKKGNPLTVFSFLPTKQLQRFCRRKFRQFSSYWEYFPFQTIS